MNKRNLKLKSCRVSGFGGEGPKDETSKKSKQSSFFRIINYLKNSFYFDTIDLEGWTSRNGSGLRVWTQFM